MDARFLRIGKRLSGWLVSSLVATSRYSLKRDCISLNSGLDALEKILELIRDRTPSLRSFYPYPVAIQTARNCLPCKYKTSLENIKKLKNGVFLDVTPCGCCNNRSFGGS
jgi:hypothetical protein